MPVDDAPPDEDTRSTYNFAPGYYGLVYRADVPPQGAGHRHNDAGDQDGEAAAKATTEHDEANTHTKFKLQAMKWGLVPFWTKRNPDYGSVMKTINARDDSLAENRGMWNTMKRVKRCIVVAEGFYEWLKKDGGKHKVPHYVKRRDGQLMLFAGLWDCVQYEASSEQNWTYTVITTDSNKQLKFLHDRMPVILENSSDAVKTWLDPTRTEWNRELQSLLKPFEGELECYPVSKDVGKVGNDSPNFVVPIDSSENKNNIANFFASAKKPKAEDNPANQVKESFKESQASSATLQGDDERSTIDDPPRSEDNAPMPVQSENEPTTGQKRKNQDDDSSPQPKKAEKLENSSPNKSPADMSSRKFKSAISNNTPVKSPSKAKDGSQKITSFFAK
jgi:putative SOS response-associated peptidase YedK